MSTLGEERRTLFLEPLGLGSISGSRKMRSIGGLRSTEKMAAKRGFSNVDSNGRLQPIETIKLTFGFATLIRKRG